MQTGQLNVTDILAIVGTITGIIGMCTGIGALVWDYYKWRYSEIVRLDISAIPNFVSTLDPHTRHINVQIKNIGKIPTTIKMLSLHGFNSKKELRKRIGHDPAVILNPAYGSLPVRLEPGDDWIGGLTQDDPQIKKYLNYKYFCVQAEDTMSEKPFRAFVDKDRLKLSS